MTPARFDAVLFDAGGVLVLPDASVLGPLLTYYGGDPDPSVHRRAHYAAMKAKSDANAPEASWADYDAAYVRAVGVDASEREEAAHVLGRTRNPWLWRQPVPGAREAMAQLSTREVPIGVVSNASGQIARVLARSVCQVGAGPHPSVRCVVDSAVVGVSKPDPSIFDHALVHFPRLHRERIAYVGDSVTTDIASASAAGLHPVLIDPFDDHAGARFERISSLQDLVVEFGSASNGTA